MGESLPKRIVFDLHDTLVWQDDKGGLTIRAGAMALLGNLRQQGFDLILWTGADGALKRLKQQHPEVLKFFSSVYDHEHLPRAKAVGDEPESTIKYWMQLGYKIPRVVESWVLVDDGTGCIDVAGRTGAYGISSLSKYKEEPSVWASRVADKIQELFNEV